MVTTFMDQEQKKLKKKFHTLLGKCGIGQDGKEAILESYGVQSSRELSAKELLDICDKLTLQAYPELARQDKLRKRVIAVIFKYYDALGRAVDMDYVKGTACRAAGHERFNDIPGERLNNLYYAFRDKIKDIRAVGRITVEDLPEYIGLN
ncbi:MAG: hypothetical protein LBE91_20790 [Tannerella sp.]|jgi:hypothetical protein|nr:hypothetical protein [Tannerella sp.]